MKIFVTILFCFLTFALKAQVNLNQRISIQVDNVPLDSVFKILHTKHNIHLAFGIDNIPSNTKITIQANNQTLLKIIQNICDQTGMTYSLIGHSIVLRYIKPSLNKQPVTNPPVSPIQHHPEIQTMRDSIQGPSLLNLDTLQTVSQDSIIDHSRITYPTLDSLRTKQEATPAIAENHLLTSPSQKANAKFNPRLTASGIFINYALDYNQFHFQERDISFQKFTPEKNNSVCIGAYTVFNKKLYLSLGIGYASRDFVLSYNFQVLDTRDPLPIPDQTKIKLTYIELPLTIGYHIYSKKRLSLWMSTGFYQSFLAEKNETTTYLNKGNPDTDYFLNTNQSTLCSLTLGFITHYYVYKRWGIFVEAGYLYCFDKVNTDVMEANTTIYRIKSGIHFSIHPKIKPS